MRNACAQRALASLLGEDPRAVHARHPPDTPLALLGTTPWALERMCREEGLDAARVRGEAALRRALAAGRAALVLVDAWRLERRLGYHWAVARADHGEALLLTHLTRAPTARLVPWPAFRRAWRSWVPGAYRECAIVVRGVASSRRRG